MKKVLILLMILSAGHRLPAKTDYVLLRNNRLEVQTSSRDQNTGPELVQVKGIAPDQELVAITRDPSGKGLNALGYNHATREAQLYFIHPRTFNASLLVYTVRRLDLGNGRGVSISNLGNDLVSIRGSEGQIYELERSSGKIVAMTPARTVVSPDHPYSGAVRPADELLRYQGIVSNDPPLREPAISRPEDRVYDNGTTSGNLPFVTQLYPNPATSITRLQLSNPANKQMQLYVIDLNGRIVQEYDIDAGTRQLDADVSALPPGLYGLQLIQGGTMIDQPQKLVRKE